MGLSCPCWKVGMLFVPSLITEHVPYGKLYADKRMNDSSHILSTLFKAYPWFILGCFLVKVGPLWSTVWGLKHAVLAVILRVHSLWWRSWLDQSFLQCRRNCSLSHRSWNQSNWLTGSTHTSIYPSLCEASLSYEHCLSFPVWLHSSYENGIVSYFPVGTSLKPSRWLNRSPFLPQLLSLSSALEKTNPEPLVFGRILSCLSQVRELWRRGKERTRRDAGVF